MVDVVIAGAGPVGCFLARELRLAGAQVVVLEAEKMRSPYSKALTMNSRSLELLQMRGLAERFMREGVLLPTAHYAVLDTRLALAPLDTKIPYTLALAQRRTEELLEAAAREFGAEFRFAHAVSALHHDEGGVEVHVRSADEGDYIVRARYVVGCDGARSTVRSSAGISFPGTDATMTAFQGDARLAQPPTVTAIVNERGGMMMLRQADGSFRVVIVDPTRMHIPKECPPAEEELRDAMRRIAGTDFGLTETLWLSRFGNATRQAASYRKGRIFLAGDAAHIHFPAGGQGMNVGLQDASNLGWKLGAVLRGAAPEALLDTYHDERHPIGADVLENTRAQEALIGFTPQIAALRATLAELLTAPEANRRLAEKVTGIGIDYGRDRAHPWVGRRLPDLPTTDGASAFQRMHAGHFLLLDGGVENASQLVEPWMDRITVAHADVAGVRPGLENAGAILVRPDGHVAGVLNAH
ncbi:FAD-dependent monooxygenase [Pendulispora brunnea]|uniref:FAD-dependent monooxygenase n=1 Tax=Pendulispora brunnea TaxID=2905690 RepID=A0ABZ2KA42_9BACT